VVEIQRLVRKRVNRCAIHRSGLGNLTEYKGFLFLETSSILFFEVDLVVNGFTRHVLLLLFLHRHVQRHSRFIDLRTSIIGYSILDLKDLIACLMMAIYSGKD
jgi:hypothetical protein